MIKLTSNCNDCSHADICRYKDNAKMAMEKLKNMQYGKGPNDDYDWDTIMKSKNVNITFSCPDYRPEKLIRQHVEFRDGMHIEHN